MNALESSPCSTGPRRRLIIVDHSLVGVSGHHFEYDSALVTAAREAGVKPIVLCHVDYAKAGDTPEATADAAEALPVEPWFVRSVYKTEEGRHLRRLFYHMIAALPPPLGRALHETTGKVWARLRCHPPDAQKGFGGSLLAALDLFGSGPQDAVLVHTLGLDDLEELAAALMSVTNRSLSLPSFHILLRRPHDDMDRGRPLGRRLADILNRLAANDVWLNRMRFYSDTPQLAAAFSALSPLRFDLLPIVFRHDLLDAALAVASRPAGAPTTVAYLGGARVEKGFRCLPELISGVAAARPKGSVRFIIQSTLNVPGGEPGIGAALRRLAVESSVQLIHKVPTAASFYALLAAADIVLLPYDRTAYVLRSSGIQAQAMAAGRPVLVPAGTWLSDELAASGGAGLTFERPSDLAPRLLSLIENYSAFRQRAEAIAPAWRTRHNPRQLIERVMADGTPSAEESL